jgi:hypothetical protein
VLIEKRYEKRFKKPVQRLGLKLIPFIGVKELGSVIDEPNILAVFISDVYSGMPRSVRAKFDAHSACKIVYQNRKRPQVVELEHDVYIWEPRSLPRAVSGSVVVANNHEYLEVMKRVRSDVTQRIRLENGVLVTDIRMALRGYENKYRRIDKRPPRILSRLLYDLYT